MSSTVVTPGESVKVQLSWGAGHKKTDLDCAAIAFSESKVMVDVCFYNKRSACNNIITHSGDSQDGLGPGVDEEITLDLRPQRLESICGFIFVVNSCTDVKLSDIQDGTIAFKGSSGQTLGEAPLPSFDAFGVVSAIFYRKDTSGAWNLSFTNTPTKGQNFQDSMPQVQKALTKVVGNGFQGLQGDFDLVKHDVVTITAPLPLVPLEPEEDEPTPVLTNDGDDLFVGLGWTCSQAFDLDSGVILCDGVDGGRALNVVNFQDGSFGKAVRYSGDNRTGKGEGDDEQIMLDLDCLPHAVKSLVIVVNVYTSGGTFAGVSQAYVRLVRASDKKELLRFTLSGASLTKRGLIFAKIHRTPGGGWAIREMFKECAAQCTARDKEVFEACGVSGMAADDVIDATEAAARTKQPPFRW